MGSFGLPGTGGSGLSFTRQDVLDMDLAEIDAILEMLSEQRTEEGKAAKKSWEKLARGR